MLVSAVAVAQTAPTPAVTPPRADETLVLSPFVVNTSKDVGFVATSSLAGGRLAGDLKDTPAAYSVLTRELLDALGLNEMTEATQWVTNSALIPDDGRQEIFGTPIQVTFRGLNGNTAQRNFFPFNVNFDSYNLDRVDFARGPNAVLFGNGSFGGTTNVVTKHANLSKNFAEVKATVGSWADYRATLDINRQVFAGKMAARLNLMNEDRDGWRDREYLHKRGGHLTLTYHPFANTDINIEGESGSNRRNTALASINDRLSGWDGVTTFTGPIGSLPSNASALGVARLGSSTAPYYLYSPGTGLAGLTNFANTGRTEGANLSTGVNGVPIVGPTPNIQAQPMTYGVDLPANLLNHAIQGSDFRLPNSRFTLSPDAPTFVQLYRTYSAFLDQQVGEHFFFQAAGNYAWERRQMEYWNVRGGMDTFVDINRTLPGGAANPKFLQPYNESIRYRNERASESYEARFAAAAVFDGTRFGDFHLNLIAGENWTENTQKLRVYTITRNADHSKWANVDNFRYRFYWNDQGRPLTDFAPTVNLTDPIAGTTSAVPVGWVIDTTRNTNGLNAPQTDKYLQSALSAKLLKGRLNIIAAARRDEYEAISRSLPAQRDFSPDWDGSTLYQRPDAPADYLKLVYLPKDTAGHATGVVLPADTRPRDASGVALPQYSGDRFRDDFNAPVTNGIVNTTSIGGVYSINSWISVFYNHSESFNPPGSAVLLSGELFPAQASQGHDYGLRFRFLAGRVYATLTGYSGKENNQSLDTGAGSGLPASIPLTMNVLLQANATGDLTTGGRNIRGLLDLPQAFSDRRDRTDRGYEFEIVANLTQNWRLTANAAIPKAYQTNAFSDTRAYLLQNDATLRLIAADAGVLIDSSNNARVDPSVPVNVLSPDAQSAANAWNTLQNIRNNIVTGSQKIARLADFTGNIFTDYTFLRGRLRGFKLGGGVNYHGREVIGYRGSDTIRDPNNPNAAIADPSVSAYTPVYAAAYYRVTGVVGYGFKLGKVPVQVDLRASNLLNSGVAVYYTTVQRPLGGDITNPARRATGGLYSLPTPRSFSLSASVKF